MVNMEQGMEWLEKSIAQNEDGLTLQFQVGAYAPIRNDPRWQAFRERTGTAEAQLAAIPFDVSLPK